MPARITEPAVGASTCASGSQVCTGHIGTLTAKDAKKPSHSQRRDPGEPLVMPQVQVGLGAVVGDEHLAVLGRAHRPRIDVDIGVELAEPDAESPGLQPISLANT